VDLEKDPINNIIISKKIFFWIVIKLNYFSNATSTTTATATATAGWFSFFNSPRHFSNATTRWWYPMGTNTTTATTSNRISKQ
jgi:hypothetical protein